MRNKCKFIPKGMAVPLPLDNRWNEMLRIYRQKIFYLILFKYESLYQNGVSSIITLLYVHSSIAIILMGKRELIALLNLSSWCLVMVERLFLTVPRGCLQFVIVVFPDHTHLLFSVV